MIQTWFHGPEFLLDPNLNLESFNTPLNIRNLSKERKIALPSISRPKQFCELVFEKFSSFFKLQRTIAFVLRFAHNIKNPSRKKVGTLSVTELDNSLIATIKNIQSFNFKILLKEIKAEQIISDTDGLLRVGGRLENIDIPFSQKYPLLLPSNEHVVHLLLKKENTNG